MYETGMEIIARMGPWFFIFIWGSWMADFLSMLVNENGLAHKAMIWLSIICDFCAGCAGIWHIFTTP